MANYYSCRRSYKLRDKIPGLLYPLLVLFRTWSDLSIDFYKPGTNSHGYNNVFVVADKLNKRYTYLPTKKQATTKTAAGLFYKYL